EVSCTVASLAPGPGASWPLGILGGRLGVATVQATAAAAPGEADLTNNSASRNTDVTSPPVTSPPPTSTSILHIAPAWVSPDDLTPGSGLWLVERVIAEAATVSDVMSRVAAVARAVAADVGSAELGVIPAPVSGVSVPPAVTRAAPVGPPTADSQIWVLNAVTGAGVPLTLPASNCPPRTVCPPVPLSGRVPGWAPDGLRIAYEDAGAIRVAHLGDVGSDGTADVPEVVTGVDAVTGFGPNNAPTPSRPFLSAATDPAWSPDGAELAVAGTGAGQPQQQGIYALKPDGTGLRTIAQDRGVETEPAWQPYADLAVTLNAAPTSVATGDATTLSATVTSSGPARANAVTLRLDIPAGLSAGAVPPACTLAGTVVTCDLGTLAKGASATRSVPTTATTTGDQVVTAVTEAQTPDAHPSDNTSTATVAVTELLADLAVAVSVTSPGYVGGTGTATFTVSNAGPATATGIQLSVGYPTDQVKASATPDCLTGSAPCSLPALPVGQSTVLTAALNFTHAGTGSVTANVTGTVADPMPANNLAATPITVKQPTLRLDPTVAAPGGVTIVTGSDIPPGSELTLSWNPGLTEVRGPVTVAPDGTIPPTQVIVFRKDILGERSLLATAVVAGQFDPVPTTMLVAPQRANPPDFIERD
ncbi:MAG: hypothetical protein WCG47_07770, partial [Dermatophilaceae bacterium]